MSLYDTTHNIFIVVSFLMWFLVLTPNQKEIKGFREAGVDSYFIYLVSFSVGGSMRLVNLLAFG